MRLIQPVLTRLELAPARSSTAGLRALQRVALPFACIVLVSGCATSNAQSSNWAQPNLNASSTRAATASGITRANVHSLHLLWRWRFRIPPGDAGAFTATPLIVNGIVYLEDMKSNVFALRLTTGKTVWAREFGDANPGPNGLAFADGRVYGATDTSAFALSARTGKLLWSRFLVTPTAIFVDTAPLVSGGTMFVSTIGQGPDGQGVLYALNAATGAIRWSFSTIKGRWRFPAVAGGGGAWYPPSVANGLVYWGTANPLPFGGTPSFPDGAAFPGPALYTDSLLVLNAHTGGLEWYDQVTPHDVRDHDFQLPPIVASIGSTPVVFGGGKAGVVIAWNRTTHQRIWQRVLGLHRNDRGPLPRNPVSVCPGLFGGIETPMAYSNDELFVPIVNLCMRASATGYESLANVNVSSRGRGEFVALNSRTGATLWLRTLPQADFGCATVANGVVFTSTYDGSVYGFDTTDGTTLWHARTSASINACPAIAGNVLLVGAGVSRPGATLELEAFAT